MRTRNRLILFVSLVVSVLASLGYGGLKRFDTDPLAATLFVAISGIGLVTVILITLVVAAMTYSRDEHQFKTKSWRTK